MANNPLSQNLPADLPTNWQNGQIVAPNGASVGLSTQHGYNYLMQQGNASQNAINTIGAAFSGVFGKNETIPVANGGTGATTATNARTNLSVYSQSEVNNLLSPMNNSITSLGSTKLNTIGKGVNLLDNWYFIGGGSQQGGGQFPINQRGQTSYTYFTNNTYNIDRWYFYGGDSTMTLNSDSLRITDSGSDNWLIGQTMSGVLIPGQTYTLSVLYKTQNSTRLRIGVAWDAANSKWFYNLEAPATSTYQLATITGTIPSNDTVVEEKIFLQALGTDCVVDFKAIKLELGDTQTLARQENGQWVLNDPPPNYALELAKCNMSLASLDDSYTNFPFLHIANGSYVGTGTYGESTPNTLSFSFAPKIIWCSSNMNYFKNDATRIAYLYTPLVTTSYTLYCGFCEEVRGKCYGKKSSDGKTFSWYSTDTSYGPSSQNNTSGTTYYYTAIG